MNLENSLIRIDKLKIHDNTISEQEKLQNAVKEHEQKIKDRHSSKFGTKYKIKRKKKIKLAKKNRQINRKK